MKFENEKIQLLMTFENLNNPMFYEFEKYKTQFSLNLTT